MDHLKSIRWSVDLERFDCICVNVHACLHYVPGKDLRSISLRIMRQVEWRVLEGSEAVCTVSKKAVTSRSTAPEVCMT